MVSSNEQRLAKKLTLSDHSIPLHNNLTFEKYFNYNYFSNSVQNQLLFDKFESEPDA